MLTSGCLVPMLAGNGVELLPKAQVGLIGKFNSSSNLFTLARSTDDFVTPTDYYEWGVGCYRPVNDATISLGQSTFRWTTVYATNGVINTSDARDKENIESLGYGFEWDHEVRPVIFNWKQNPQWGKRSGSLRKRWSLFYREVVQTGNLETKTEDDTNSKADKNDKLGIYYSDIIPVAVKPSRNKQQMIENRQRKMLSWKKKCAAWKRNSTHQTKNLVFNVS